jgi:hypothetical protein
MEPHELLQADSVEREPEHAGWLIFAPLRNGFLRRLKFFLFLFSLYKLISFSSVSASAFPPPTHETKTQTGFCTRQSEM